MRIPYASRSRISTVTSWCVAGVSERLLRRFDNDSVRPHTEFSHDVSTSECALDVGRPCSCITLSQCSAGGVATLQRSRLTSWVWTQHKPASHREERDERG